jgi:flagellar assembly factor FliW
MEAERNTMDTPPTASSHSEASVGASNEHRLQTRFGELTLDPTQALHLEKGMLGMPEQQSFCLLEFPVQKFHAFRLLQSTEDGSLSFIVLPVGLDNPFVAKEDVLETAQDIGIAPQNLALYLVVNIYREVNYVRMSANCRAPLFIDQAARKGEQCVLKNNHYLVRQMLNSDLTGPANPGA